MQNILDKAFNTDMAARYDSSRAHMQPLKDALHWQMQALFASLPEDAHLLCVGAGTGEELLYLARAFPGRHFTLVDPAAAMLARCQQKAHQQGIAQRCTFFSGYLHDMQDTTPFDAATSILVSHFILPLNERRAYYRQIARRLKPGAILVNADLSWDRQAASFADICQHWVALHQQAGMSTDPSYLNDQLSLASPSQMQSLIKAAGFSTVTPFFQAMLVHGWYSIRAD
ncbi:class I SAM-dependent methyltransferase [Bowmanella denitrificans]|uniref:class I SAM-dependent methyltransferase n=1 Tax=Bowmanella denitrificans TaxID=366582 RepID=UPI000C9D142B|nr:class I SAM-dependent methyltransferase [Bowmanella denitrificans]